MTRVEGGAWGVSRVLGTAMPTKENWLDYEWVKTLHGLPSRGVTLASFQSWCRNVSLGNPFCPDMDSIRPGLVELLPNLFLNKQALQSKTHALRLYISGLDEQRFHEEAYLQEIKAHLEVHRHTYWRRLDVAIRVQCCRLSHRVPVRVREFYSRVLPEDKRARCVPVQEGLQVALGCIRPWVMQCGGSTGAYRTKKVARMIAIIREHLDPGFDLEDRYPPPTMRGLWNEVFQSRKGKYEDMIQDHN